MKTEMMFRKFGRSKFVQMRLKKVTKEMMNLHVVYMKDCLLTLIY